MYIRFAIEQKDNESAQKMGVFMAMDMLYEKDKMYSYEQGMESELYNWFKKNLKVPKVQSGNSSNYYRKSGAISWFKSSAKEHIEKMRQYSQLLEAHDINVQQLTTTKPGVIVYEDPYQIAAIPFKDTFK